MVTEQFPEYGAVSCWTIPGCWDHTIPVAGTYQAQLMLLPFTISCSWSRKSRLVLPSWFYLSGAGSLE